MKPRHLLAFLIVTLASVGCHGSKSGQPTVNVPAVVAAVVLGGGPIVLDPLATTALLLGVLTIRNETALGTPNGDIDYRVDAPAGTTTSETTLRLAPGEQRVIQVFTTLVLAAIVTLTVYAVYAAGGTERAFPIEWQNLAANSRAFALMNIIAAPLFAVLWYQSAARSVIGVLTKNSNPLVPQRVPARAQDIRMFGAILWILTVANLVDLFGGLDGPGGPGQFPVGQGPNGYTVPATPSATLTSGEYITFWMSVSDDIPLNSNQELYQYAFVCDSDTNPANNYQPTPAFPDDFFGGTDRWYELNYTPAGGWTLRCRVVGAGNSISTVASGARAVISGDTIVMIVPRSEFVVSNPPFRATTFAHQGDFGQNPPYHWSGDPTPTVDETLHAWQ